MGWHNYGGAALGALVPSAPSFSPPGAGSLGCWDGGSTGCGGGGSGWGLLAWSCEMSVRRAAFSMRSWSTSWRQSSQRRFASSADASAASSSCERDSSALTCLHGTVSTRPLRRRHDSAAYWSLRSLNARCAFLFCSARLLWLRGRPAPPSCGGDPPWWPGGSGGGCVRPPGV